MAIARKMYLISQQITPVNYMGHDVLTFKPILAARNTTKTQKFALTVYIIISLQAKLQLTDTLKNGNTEHQTEIPNDFLNFSTSKYTVEYGRNSE